jgi:hypothetical protein
LNELIVVSLPEFFNGFSVIVLIAGGLRIYEWRFNPKFFGSKSRIAFLFMW